MSNAGKARATRVFVSYSRADAALVEPIAAALTAAGHEVLVDTAAILKAEEWQPRLASLIAAADAVAFFLSATSARSSVCAWEVETAERLGKRIVPVVLEAVPEAEVPRALARRNYIFARDAGERARAAGEIATAADTDIGWVREHTRVGELAQRWQEQRQPGELLLRGGALTAAETWVAAPPATAPPPTALQHAFIAQSRKAASRRTRVLWAIAATAALVMTAGGLALRYQQVVNERERAAEVQRAQDAITEELLRTVEKLDARIGYVVTATGGASGAVPGLPPAVAAGTEALMAEQRVASLQQLLNSAPLNIDLRAETTRRAAATGAAPALIGQFYDALADVTWATDALLTGLKRIASEPSRDAAVARYHADRLRLLERRMRHASNVVLRQALAVLWSMGVAPAAVDPRLAALRHLEPRAMPPDGPAHGLLLARDIVEQGAILAEQGRLEELSRTLFGATAQEAVAGPADDLAAKPDDTPQKLIMKARALRQLGKRARAIEMFALLGERFPGAIPTMATYVATAQAFTRDFGLEPEEEGGVWLEALRPDGHAARHGLRDGDIVLAYGGRRISLTEQMKEAVAAAPSGSPIEVVIARRGADGAYQRRKLAMPAADDLGIAMMRPM